MAVLGLEKTFYRVLENVSVVEVCAIVYNSCPISFPFDVRLSTIDDSAGNTHNVMMILYNSIIHSVLCSCSHGLWHSE